MLGFHHCVECGGLIWPWQQYGWRVQRQARRAPRVVYWHGKHWRGQH